MTAPVRRRGRRAGVSAAQGAYHTGRRCRPWPPLLRPRVRSIRSRRTPSAARPARAAGNGPVAAARRPPQPAPRKPVALDAARKPAPRDSGRGGWLSDLHGGWLTERRGPGPPAPPRAPEPVAEPPRRARRTQTSRDLKLDPSATSPDMIRATRGRGPCDALRAGCMAQIEGGRLYTAAGGRQTLRGKIPAQVPPTTRRIRRRWIRYVGSSSASSP